jgi:hypothetical protein
VWHRFGRGAAGLEWLLLVVGAFLAGLLSVLLSSR